MKSQISFSFFLIKVNYAFCFYNFIWALLNQILFDFYLVGNDS